MKKILRNGLFMLAATTFAVSCADYNDLGGFKADPDPTFSEPYKDLQPIKSYVDRNKYPNMTLGVTLKVANFNKQELEHAAAITNFDNLSFGTTLMSGSIINEKGIMNFLDFKDLLDHCDELGAEVYGSPIAANANQADGWLKQLTAPVEIKVPYYEDVNIDYANVDKVTSGKIEKYDGENILQIGKRSKVRVADLDSLNAEGTYTITIRCRAKDDTKNGVFYVKFCSDDRLKDDPNAKEPKDRSFTVAGGKWVTVKIEDLSIPEGATEGYVIMDVGPNVEILVKSVKVGHYPDNHRPQTEQELNDTIRYALDAWCDGLMKYNEGRINLFDLVDEPLDTKNTLENGYYDLKHADSGLPYWQDVLGNENYAPAVANSAREGFVKYGGNADELTFFISESDLTDEKKLESLNYWINIWNNNGANIQGINAKFPSSFSYYEDPAKQAAQVAAIDKMFDNLAATGKLIRISNFDIKYTDAEGNAVAPPSTDADNNPIGITAEQRQKLADYYAYIIKSYMTKIPAEKQAGICKGNMVDTGDPVGLWSIVNPGSQWVRNATYKAWCDVLGGQ